MIVSLRNVGRSYRSRGGVVQAVTAIDLDVAIGERVALIGPSGAGKTTLLRILNATQRPTEGTYRCGGRDVGEMSSGELRAMRRRVGFVPQQANLVPALSALDNTLCGALGRWSLWRTVWALAFPPPDEVARALAVLETVGLTGKQHARADELSGGQQQRVAIARMLMQGPELVLADEPLASLDPALAETVMRLLLEAAPTVIATLHDVDAALRHFPRIVALRGGRVVFDRPASAVGRDEIDALYGSEAEQDRVGDGDDVGDGDGDGDGERDHATA